MLFKEELNNIFIEVALNDILFDYYWSITEFIIYYHKIIRSIFESCESIPYMATAALLE